MAKLRELLSVAPVLPVITIDDAARAVDLAKALAAGGIGIAEITLRTPAGLPSIELIAARVPNFVVAAGTVLTPADLDSAARAGARFAVSPGSTRELLEAAASNQALPFLPAVATPSELMQAAGFGHDCFKLFPAAALGGVAALDALGGPFPDARFCPTGGIGESSAADYLARPNVLCVGGSWLAPRAAIARGDWAAITESARKAAALPRPSKR
ncbi:MAG TPA: bifunctional 4-hydroxy-2-oxoglutarate aldolase/2-dehydro-3-deoxy-phosphogluconate aldolase [Gammaproteobacteria bacterium]|nr:bifunctional 4-hydroxy-2-oxoglutarate aldolase/2-dehydro-3-deoxy-phosphogluconate aldolase [Gammaproteobacteria bacterium]